MKTGNRSTWVIILIVGGVLILLCLCAVILGGGAAYIFSGANLPEGFEINMGDDQASGDDEAPGAQPTLRAEKPAAPTAVKPAVPKPTARKATAVAQPTQAPAEPDNEPTEDNQTELPEDQPAESPLLTGKQEWSENRIFDDFSSNSLEWFQYDSDTYAILVENGAYSIHVKTAENSAWADFPVDFVPYEFSFDVRGPAGDQDGGFGVDCQYLDDDNLYFLEFDLGTGEYSIAAEKEGVITPLTKKNAQGQYWQKTSALKKPASTANHIAVSCYLDSITLFINNKLVDQVTVSDPLTETGTTNLFVYTFRSVEGDGYKVTFDNLEAYQPRQ